jgi:DNA-binding response OmpR family regulator
MNEHILVVEDKKTLATVLSKYLLASHYTVSILNEGTGVDGWVREHKPHLILLDLMLAGPNGLEICRDIRLFSRVPIIMVTAMVERTIDSHTRKLRRKIEEVDPKLSLIHSVYSAGYKFEQEPLETAEG